MDASANTTGINQLTASYFAGNGSGITNIDVSNLDATGADTQVQFNQNGEFGAAAGFTFDGTGSVASSVMLSSADLKASNLTDNRLPLVGASGLLQDNAAFLYADDRSQMNGYVGLYVSSSVSGATYVTDGYLGVYDNTDTEVFSASPAGVSVGDNLINFGVSTGNISGSGNLTIGGNLEMYGGAIDMSAAGSGVSAINMTDNLNEGFMIRVDGDSNWMTFKTDNGDERVTSDKAFYASSTISGSSTLQIGSTAAFAGNVSANSADEANNFAGTSGALRTLGGISAAKKVQAAGDIRSESGVYAGDAGFGNFAARLASDGSISGSASLQLGGGASVAGNVIAAGNLNTTGGNISGSSALMIGGASTLGGMVTLGSTVTAASLGTAIIDLTADLMIIDDGAAGSIKTTSLANYATALTNGTNEGLASTAGRLELDLSDLVAGDFTHGSWYNDTFAFVDVNDSDITKKESLADFMTKVAGTGITATNGVLSVSAQSTPTAFGDVAATMVEGLNYASAALTAARVLTLPNSDDLDVGEFVKIKMAAGLSSTIYASVAIAVGSGDLIDGDASIRLESPYAAVNLYKVAENVWRIL